MTDTFPDNTEMDLTTATVIPTRGAIVKASYITSIGERVLLTFIRAHNEYIPFGAVVKLNSEVVNTSIVGDKSQAYISGMPEKGSGNVKWGEGTDQSCNFEYNIKTAPYAGGIYLTTVKCK